MKKYITRKNQEVGVIKRGGLYFRCCVECAKFDRDLVNYYSCGGVKCVKESCQSCLSWTSPGCFKPDPQTS